MKSLVKEDLKDGDVLLLQDTNEYTHKFIAVAQALFTHNTSGGHYNITHAGLYGEEGGVILEASGAKGLRAAPLDDKKGYTYLVYRYSVPHADGSSEGIARKAAEWAWKLIGDRNSPSGTVGGEYSLGRRAGGVLGLSFRGPLAQQAVRDLRENPYKNRTFYCSNFVVAAYELACANNGDYRHDSGAFDVDYRYVTPKKMQAVVNSHRNWKFVGRYGIPLLTVPQRQFEPARRRQAS